MSAFLANDGAVLILTPVVLALLTPLGVSKAQQLAFVNSVNTCRCSDNDSGGNFEAG